MERSNHSTIIRKLFLITTAVLLWSCEGPMGPEGPPGTPGQDGVNIVGEVFEIIGDFTQEGNFGLSGEYGFEILESDKVLIYRLADVDQEGNDIWKLIPQVVFHQNGIFTYDYDFTFYDYSIYMSGEFDLNSLEAGFTDDQIFRVLIVPADRIDLRMDYSDHYGVLKMLKVDEEDIPKIHLN
ncbi:hypothetical protein [Cyclobacterium jeungdonense]|uniref:Collagen-like protein n=1 Tax=Cyclobacterium jeungdonense TaxID=708087 RepID=A0ABT8C3H1_9BACT|nr:hypothetical protein [Cyclobacterium jeungdonense]MDN3686632.1 hypothetical protein [Cyclobacterium jeungdonense]